MNILRFGTFADFEQLFFIYMHESVNRFLSFEIMTQEKFKAIFFDLFQKGQLYVYQRHEKIIATCIVMRHTRRCHHVATLGTLAIHPEYQRQGIGTEFLRALIKILKTQGIIRVDLYVEADNAIALAFYEKYGFQCEGILKKYVKRLEEDQYTDEHVMALLL